MTILEDMMSMDMQRFLNLPIQQIGTMPYALTKFFDRHKDIRQVVEIGTAAGGTAVLFGIAMSVYPEGEVWSYDTNEPSEECRRVARSLPVRFVKSSCWQPSTMKEIRERLGDRRQTLLFCDGGNKALEVRQFAPFLKSGDYMMAHDWGVQIKETDIQPIGFEFSKSDMDLFGELKALTLCMQKK